MHLVKIDMLDAETSKQIVERDVQMPPRQPDVIRAVAHRETSLRGNHRLASFRRPRLQPAADDLFRNACAIDIGGVDKIAAPFEIVVSILCEVASSASAPNVIVPRQ